MVWHIKLWRKKKKKTITHRKIQKNIGLMDIGLIKDEKSGKIMTKFEAMAPKPYFYYVLKDGLWYRRLRVYKGKRSKKNR